MPSTSLQLHGKVLPGEIQFVFPMLDKYSIHSIYILYISCIAILDHVFAMLSTSLQLHGKVLPGQIQFVFLMLDKYSIFLYLMHCYFVSTIESIILTRTQEVNST